MAERLTSGTPDLEVRGSSLARHVSLDKALYSTLSVLTRVYINGCKPYTSRPSCSKAD